MTNDEIIGFHKGSISTLIKEREELVKIVNVVDQLIHMHMESLKKLGVNLDQQKTAKKK